MADSYNELFGLGSHSPDANLEGWWPLMDNAANTAVADYSGKAVNGVASANTSLMTMAGPNSWLTAAMSMASSRYITVSSAVISNTAGTLLGRFKSPTTATGSDSHFIFASRNGDSANTRIYLRMEASGGANHPSDAACTFGANTNNATTNNNVNGGNVWHDLEGAWTTSGVSSRLDGASNGTASYSSFTADGGIQRIGADAQSTPSFFTVLQISDVSCWTRELTTGERDQWRSGPEPVNTVAPALSGTEEEDETLSVTTGTWGLDSPFSGGTNGTITYSYQWTRSDDGSGTGEANISGATSSTYTLTATDVGKYIRCWVRATNDGGFDADADTASDFTGAIAAAGGGGGLSIPIAAYHYNHHLQSMAG